MSWTFEYEWGLGFGEQRHFEKEVLSEEEFYEWAEDNFPDVIEELGATDESWNYDIHELMGRRYGLEEYWGAPTMRIDGMLVTVYCDD